MGVTAVNNIPDIVIKPRADMVSGHADMTDRQPVQLPGQGLDGNKYDEKFSEEKINKVIEQANQSLAELNTKLSFTIHEQTKEVMVKVLDADSGEIIKEIPSQKTLDRLAAVLEDIGWIIDRKV